MNPNSPNSPTAPPEYALLIEFAAPGETGTVGLAWSLPDATRVVRAWQQRCGRELEHAPGDWKQLERLSDPIPRTSSSSSDPIWRPVWTAAMGQTRLTLSKLGITLPTTPIRYTVPGLPDQRVIEYFDGPVLVCGRDPDAVPYLAAWMDRTQFGHPDDPTISYEIDTWRVLRVGERALAALLSAKYSLDSLREAAQGATDAYLCFHITALGQQGSSLHGVGDDDLSAARRTWNADEDPVHG